jgi:transposase-like protein
MFFRDTSRAIITENWKNPPTSWHAAKAQLAIQFEDRFVLSE